LVWPSQRRDHRPLRLFKQWLRSQIDLFVEEARQHSSLRGAPVRISPT
jgi:hypothetical protein